MSLEMFGLLRNVSGDSTGSDALSGAASANFFPLTLEPAKTPPLSTRSAGRITIDAREREITKQ